MKDEILGKLEARVILKHGDKYYQLREMKANGTIKGEQDIIVICREIGSEKISKFKLRGEGFLEPFLATAKAEQETGCNQILLIDLDTGEWRSYPITNELKRRFPFLRDEKDYIV